jgi:hypothetical protein
MKSLSGRKHTNGSRNRSVKRRILATAAVAGLAAGGILAPTVAGATTSTNSKATVVVSGKTYKLTGGACLATSSRVALGIGTATNSLGLSAKVNNGKFTNAHIGMILNGKPVAITTGTGTVSSNGGKFKGTDVVSNSTVTGTFTC